MIQSAVENDDEDEEIVVATTECGLTRDEAIMVNEDINNVNLTKQNSSGMPMYSAQTKSSACRNFSMFNRKGKSPFIEYNGAFIRKSTALYLLQENKQLSNDRLLRVRASQPGHLFNGESELGTDQERVIVRSGDLCFFRVQHSTNILIGRIIQFSYLEGSKKERQYSSTYVDMSLESFHNIGVFANWYQGT